MSTKRVHVFISHAWKHSEHYETLSKWIFGESWSRGQVSLEFHDYSVPKDDPIHDAPTVDAQQVDQARDQGSPGSLEAD